jgi:hypothetical protein
MADNEVVVKITGQDDGFSSTMEKAAEGLNVLPDTISGVQSAFNDLQDSIKRAAETALGFLSGEALMAGFEKLKEGFSEITTGAMESGEQLEKMSLETNTSVGHLQELEFAAKATGTEFSSLIRVAGQVQRELIGISEGTNKRGASVLAAAGIDPAQLTSAYGVVTQISDAMERLGENSQQVRDVLVTFGGRQGLQLEPMIAQFRELSDEAQKMGLILDDDTVRSLDQAQEKFNILGAVVDAAKERIGASFLPILTDVANELTLLAQKIDEFAQTGALRRWADEAIAALAGVVEWFSKLTATIAQHNDIVGVLLAAAGAEVAMNGSVVSGLAMITAGWKMSGSAADEAAGKFASVANAVADAAAKAKQAALGDAFNIHSQISGGEPIGGGSGGGFQGANTEGAKQAAEAAKKALDDRFRDFQAEQALEVAQAGGTAAAKIAADQKVVAEAAALFGQHSLQWTEALTRELDEANHVADEKVKADQRATAEMYADIDSLADKAGEAYEKEAKEAQKTADDIGRSFSSMLEPISQGFDQLFSSIVRGTESISQAFKKMGIEMAESLAKSGLKDILMGGSKDSIGASIFGTQGAGGGLAGMMASAFGGPAITGSLTQALSAAFRSAQSAISSVFSVAMTTAKSALSSAAGSAASSAAGAGASAAGTAAQTGAMTSAITLLGTTLTTAISISTSTLSALLIAADAALTAIAAGILELTTLETVLVAITASQEVQPLGFSGGGLVPSAAGGMIAPGGLSILHPREMVLPAHLSEGVQNLINRGGAEANGDGQGQGGNQTVHVHYNVHSPDPKTFANLIHQHGDAIGKAVQDHFIRRGAAYKAR